MSGQWSRFGVLLLCLLMIVSFTTHAKAKTFCVDTAAELQAALSEAAGNGQDDIIQIVQETYYGSFVYASNEAKNLSVQGGFKISCAGREENGAKTVLDAQKEGVVLALSSDQEAMFSVEALTLQNGKVQDNCRGGIYLGTKGSVNLINNIITGNESSNGGGVCVVDSSGVILANNTIINNTAYTAGGGVRIIYSGTITLTNNAISGNHATLGYGGGLQVHANGTTLTNNSITDNSALSGGGFMPMVAQ